jgi:hypothetical protein
MTLRLYCLYLLLACGTCSTLSHAQSRVPVVAEVDRMPSMVVQGAVLPVTLTLKNPTDAELPLEMDSVGMPSGLVRVRDTAGRWVAAAIARDAPDFPTEFAPIPTPANELYRLAPNEVIVLVCAVPTLRLEPGNYTLVVANRDGLVVSREFEVIGHRTLSEITVTGAYEPPQLGRTPGTGTVTARLSLVESRVREQTMRWLLIDAISVAAAPHAGLRAYACPVPSQAVIDKAEMDYLGQVWVLVAHARGTRSLLLWRMHDLAWSTIVPETERRVTLGTTRARAFVANQNIVIAGVEGQEKFSTHSVWAMPRADPSTASAPATPPAGRP